MPSPKCLAFAALAAVLALAAAPAWANPLTITDAVQINTSGFVGSPDSFELYLQLNDGNQTGDANNSLAATNFNFGAGGAAGALDTANSTGNFGGDLNLGLSLLDGQPFNAVAAFFTPGSLLTFTLTDTFTSLDSPTPDTFGLAIIDNGAPLSTTDPDGSGNLMTITFDSTSPTTAAFSDSADSTVTPTITPQSSNPVPEPPTLADLGAGLALLAALALRRRPRAS